MAATAVIALACGGAAPTLGGAEQWAAGGNANWGDVNELLRSDDPDDVVRLGEIGLDEAAMVIPGADSDNVVILFEDNGGPDRLVTAAIVDGAIREQILALVSVHPTQTAAAVTSSGRLVMADDDDLGRALGGEPTGPDESTPVDPRIGVYYPGIALRAEYPSPFRVGALDLTEDGTVLAGGLDEGRIARIGSDGTTTHLLGPAGAGARVTADHDLGSVIAVMPLDDRVVFVAGTDGDTHLYVLADTGVRQIPDDEAASPVAGTNERRVPLLAEPYPRAAITPLAPSPDGRILTTGIGPDGDPQISLVDVDTGDIEVLATLDDVEPTIDDPVSAAIVGDDLIFLAQHQLWRLPDVVTTDEP